MSTHVSIDAPSFAPTPAAGRRFVPTPRTWAKAAAIGVLVLMLFRLTLLRLWGQINPFTGDPNWGHAIFIPLVTLAYLYTRQRELFAARPAPSAAGLLLIACGLTLYVGGIWPVISDFIQNVGILLTVGGLLVLLGGWRVGRVALPGIVFLLLACPWPPSVYRSASVALQHVMAAASAWVMQLLGTNAQTAGNRITLYAVNGEAGMLNVAEACAGLRSIFTFISLGAAMAVLSRRPWWHKLVLLFATIPVAVACNLARLTTLGLLQAHGYTWASEGAAHERLGMAMIVPGILLLLGIGRLLGTPQDSAAAIEGDAGAKASDAQPPQSPTVPAVCRFRFPAPFRSPFPVAVVGLILAIAGLNSVVNALQLHFAKQPVPLARPLATLPPDLGHWRQVSVDQPLAPDFQKALGTDKYLFRCFVDDRSVGERQIAALRRLTGDEATAAIAKIRAAQPDAVLDLALTYNTGVIDQIAHVPDQCYLAAGYEETEAAAADISPAGRRLQMLTFRFESERPEGRAVRRVGYFFHVNGHYESDSWAVRRSLLSPLEPRVYYAKVELSTALDVQDKAEAQMTDFLGDALPEIEKLLPAWHARPVKPAP